MSEVITKSDNIAALMRHADGEKTKHEQQLRLLLACEFVPPSALGWFDACEKEIDSIAYYRDQIAILQGI